MDGFHVLRPKGKMLTKGLRRLRSPIGIDFQYTQVKNLISRLQRDGFFIGTLTEFEGLLIPYDKEKLMSKIYELLLGHLKTIDKARYKWQVDLNSDLTERDWCHISGFIQNITLNVAQRTSL